MKIPILNYKEMLPLVEANTHVARRRAGRADGRTDVTKVKSVDGNYVKAPKD